MMPSAAGPGIGQNKLQAEEIEVTENELEQLCALQLRCNLRGIGDAIALFEQRYPEGEDVTKLIEVASELVMPHDDESSDLDDVPEDQHGWRLDAPKYLAPQLLPDGACTRISNNIHKAIPAHVENWQGCMSEAAKQVNTVVKKEKLRSFQLTLASEANSWLVTSDQQTSIVIQLSIHIHSPHSALEAQMVEVKDKMHVLEAKYDALLSNQKHPRSPGETSPEIEAGLDTQAKESAVIKARFDKQDKEIAGLREEIRSLKRKRADEETKEEEESPPICSKNCCYVATMRMKSGKWRKQCDGCLSKCSKKKK
jgi:hypothetical protein